MEVQVGTTKQPIYILSQEEENQLHIVKVIEKMKKDQIQEAILANNQFGIAMAIVKGSFKLQQYKQSDEIIKKVILDHFFSKVGKRIEKDEYKERIEANYDSAKTYPNPFELIVHGVDFLSSKEISQRFSIRSAVTPYNVIQIDGSNAKIIFKKEEDVKLILQKLIKDPKQLNTKLESDGDGIYRGWLDLKPYSIAYDLVLRSLRVRYATSEQMNISSASQDVINNYQVFKDTFLNLEDYIVGYFKVQKQFDSEISKLIEEQRRRQYRRKGGDKRDRSRESFANMKWGYEDPRIKKDGQKRMASPINKDSNYDRKSREGIRDSSVVRKQPQKNQNEKKDVMEDENNLSFNLEVEKKSNEKNLNDSFNMDVEKDNLPKKTSEVMVEKKKNENFSILEEIQLEEPKKSKSETSMQKVDIEQKKCISEKKPKERKQKVVLEEKKEKEQEKKVIIEEKKEKQPEKKVVVEEKKEKEPEKKVVVEESEKKLQEYTKKKVIQKPVVEVDLEDDDYPY